MHLQRGSAGLLYFVDTVEISMGHVLVLRCVTVTNYSVDVCHETYLYWVESIIAKFLLLAVWTILEL